MKITFRMLTMAALLSCSHVVFSSEAEPATASKEAHPATPAAVDDFPSRPVPIVELGNKLLDTGPLSPGFESFTGAIWQPSLLVYGTYRTALQTQGRRSVDTTEWANRLDLFANLSLTATERLLVGLRPLDDNGVYTGYRFEPNKNNTNGFNSKISTLFFEGDFGELFPKLDIWDRKGLDLGFSVGRQPISFQEGIMIDDTIDAVGITRNSLFTGGLANLRITGLYGWSKLNRSNNVEDNSAKLYGLFSEMDFPKTTVAIDLAQVSGGINGDAYFTGLSAVQRIAHVNTAFRVLTSNARNKSAVANTGTLLFVETSWTREHSDDLFYINGFAALGQYSSIARGPGTGGPLGRAGILFAAPGIGTASSALSNQASDVAGAAIGYQTFLGAMYGTRKQLILEAGFRQPTNNIEKSSAAIGARYQQAIGQHYIVQLDGYASKYESAGNGYGLRAELVIKF